VIEVPLNQNYLVDLIMGSNDQQA
jgi:hypothetical protein